MAMKKTTIWLTAAEVKNLKALSKRTGLQVSELIRRAIDAYIAASEIQRGGSFSD